MPLRDHVIIPLPTGIVTTPGGKAGSVTAFFAPRLREDGPLFDYPDWRDWPDAVSRLTFSVVADGVPVAAAVRSTASSALWRAIFPPDTPVARYVYEDRTATNLVSYGGATLPTMVKDLYGAVAQAFPDGPPTTTELLQLPEAAALLSAGGPNSSGLADVRTFHGRVGEQEDPEVTPPTFHEFVSLVSTHPQLLRALGLAVDLEFPLAGGAAPTVLRVQTDYAQGREVPCSIECTGDLLPAPDAQQLRRDHIDGWLRVGDPEYGISQTAVGEFVTRVEATEMAGAPDRDESGALPRTSSGGIAVARDNQASKVAAKFERSLEVEIEIEEAFEFGTPPPLLYSEDVTVGYRFDVWDDVSGEWHSVFRRQPTGPYRLPNGPGISFEPEPDEGMHTWTLWAEGKTTITETAGVGGIDQELGDYRHPRAVKTGDQRADPNVFTWHGWSHAAPKPSWTFDVSSGAGTEPPKATPDPDQAVQVSIDYRPTPGSLPRLRFGWTYRMRARAVDVAGNSVEFDPTDVQPVEGVTATEFYGRMEAIAPPRVLRDQPKELPAFGEDTMSIVLKSDYDVPDAQVPPDSRILFPPKVHQYLVEQHGLPAGGVEPAAYAELVRRDAAFLEDHATVDRASGELIWATYDGKEWTSLAPDDSVEYLPDPAASGVALDGVPGAADPITTPFDQDWPAPRSGRLQVHAGSAAPIVRPRPDTFFQIWAPKATDTYLSVSCTAEPSFLDEFEWFGVLDQAARAQVREAIETGQHWLFGGSSEIHLVHAVRRPLRHPSLAEGRATRTSGSTAATTIVDTILSGISTGAVIHHIEWSTPDDDGSNPAGLVLGPVQTRSGADEGISFSDRQDTSVRFEFGTTKRLDVRVEAEAVSKFWQYFTVDRDANTSDREVVLDNNGVVGRSVVVRLGDGGALEEGLDYTVDVDAGTVVFTPAAPPSAPVTIEYVARPVSRLSTEQPQGATIDLVVPSSKRPKALDVTDVVPAVAARRRARRNLIRVERSGRSFRVWLARPWFSTGAGERLAVLTNTASDETLTRWARDAGSIAGGTGAPFVPEDFARRAGIVQGADGIHDAALYDVTLDVARNEWYVDVTVEGDTSYRPWILPALARHQPDAIPDHEMGPILRIEPFRLGATRRTEIRRRGTRIGIEVTGDDHDGVPDGAGGVLFNEFTATVQERDPAVTDDDLAWFDTGTAVTLTRNGLGDWTGVVRPPASTQPLRILLTETEPVLRDVGASSVVDRVVSFVEVVDIPNEWRSRGGGGGGRSDRG